MTPCAHAPGVACGQAPVHALRLPFRLSTRPVPVSRFSEPEGALPTSANTTMHGHPPRAASIPRTAFGGDEPPRAFAFVRPLSGTARADEPRMHTSEEARCGTGPIRAKVRSVFRRREAPSRPESAHLICRAKTATGGGPSRALFSHLVPRPARTQDEPPHRPSIPTPPREG